MTTIQNAAEQWLKMVESSRKHKTRTTYETAWRKFADTLKSRKIQPGKTDVSELSEKSMIWFIDDLRSLSPRSERLYVNAINGFFLFMDGMEIRRLNLSSIRLLIHNYCRKPGRRIVQLNREGISEILNDIQHMPIPRKKRDKLVALRDRAFILTLADTGLRVHEACNAKRGDLNYIDQTITTIGKGDKQAIVRLTPRALNAIRDYLNARRDGETGNLAEKPIFARHDQEAYYKTLHMSTKTGRKIIENAVRKYVSGYDKSHRITPHSFRHYFVTTILDKTGDIKLAQEYARHSSIAVTEKYVHISDKELDRKYKEIFEDDD